MTAVAATTTLAALEARVAALERIHHGCPEPVTKVDEPMRRARSAVEEAEIYSANWKWVPEPYYSWPLSKRASFLQVPSVHHLCKSLLLENKKLAADDTPYDPTNPRYILVVLQYAAELDNKQLINAIRALRPVQKRLGDNHFDFRLASQADNDRITGYTHNSVTPFGLVEKNSVPIVLAESIVPLKFFWMGGGHVHLKLGMAVSDFCRALQPIVAPISQARSNVDDLTDSSEMKEDLQVIMERRRQLTDVSEGSAVDHVVLENKSSPALKEFGVSKDLQAVMQRRRQAEEGSSSQPTASSPGGVLPTSPTKPSLKSVKMSSDLEAIMAKRRGLQED